MGRYTEFLEDQTENIDEDNYFEELIECVKNFRTFGDAMTCFLVEHGLQGDVLSAEEKAAFIKKIYKKSEVPYPRDIEKWFKENKIIEKSTALRFCFAFNLNLQETEDFLRRILLSRGLDCHNAVELVYYYCLSNGYNYQYAQKLIEKTGKVKYAETIKVEKYGELLYTSTIKEELKKFSCDDELVEFIKKNKLHFEYNNVRAYKCIKEMWNKISGENGLAYRENKNLYYTFDDKTSTPDIKKESSEWGIYMQIFGLLGADTENKDIVDYFKNNSLQTIFENNELIHFLAASCFPDKNGIDKVLQDAHMSEEKVRKMLILLCFYRYWCELALKKNSYEATNAERHRCKNQIDDLMMETGYPILYAGNPYDWIFLLALNDFDNPLCAFRHFMRMVFSITKDKDEEIKMH